MPSETGGMRNRSGGMSVSLASPDGRVVGGGVAGLLVAASPVQVWAVPNLCFHCYILFFKQNFHEMLSWAKTRATIKIRIDQYLGRCLYCIWIKSHGDHFSG